MAIKNYTSEVPAERSISNIEHRLAQAGASHIAKFYTEDGSARPLGMFFQIKVDGIPMSFKLPAKTNNVFDYLKLQRKRVPTKAQEESIRKQADRTAWKILYEWIDIQVSMIELDQAEPIEIFLPYAYDIKKDQTLFDRMKENNFKQLTEGK